MLIFLQVLSITSKEDSSSLNSVLLAPLGFEPFTNPQAAVE
jgi:hypothetical protein